MAIRAPDGANNTCTSHTLHCLQKDSHIQITNSAKNGISSLEKWKSDLGNGQNNECFYRKILSF